MKMLTRRETRKAASRWAAEARKAAAEHEEAIRAARTPEDYQAAIAAARKTAADFQAVPFVNYRPGGHRREIRIIPGWRFRGSRRRGEGRYPVRRRGLMPHSYYRRTLFGREER